MRELQKNIKRLFDEHLLKTLQDLEVSNTYIEEKISKCGALGDHLAVHLSIELQNSLIHHIENELKDKSPEDDIEMKRRLAV